MSVIKKLKQDDCKLQIAKLSEQATFPTRGSLLAAGYDLYSAEVMWTHIVYLVSYLHYVGDHCSSERQRSDQDGPSDPCSCWHLWPRGS